MKIKLLILFFLLANVKGYSQLVANAGDDTTIYHPASTAFLNGSASTGNIKHYQWSKLGGSQKQGRILHPNKDTTTITQLIIGTYVFQLKVTQNNRITSTDTVTVQVDSNGVVTLQAIAIKHDTVNRMQGYATLDGSASTGNITASNWQLISATVNEDGVAYIDNRTDLQTHTHWMPYGNYAYQLTVTNSTITKTLTADEVYQPDSVLVVNSTTGLSVGMIVFGQFIQGNTTITYISGDTVKLSSGIVYPVYTGNVITFATGMGDISKDTAYIVSQWGYLPPQQTSWHKVTSGTLAADIAAGCVYCKVGTSFVIDGANNGYVINDSNTDIYVYDAVFNNQPPGSTIFIKAGLYGEINFDLTDSLHGTLDSPIIITNYGGKVEGDFIRINNCPYCIVTGQWVSGVSGDSLYTGWDAGYAFTQGTFGIAALNHWSSVQAPSFAFTGNAQGDQLTYVEIGEGGFCGFWNKENPQGGEPNYNHQHIHKVYTHDTGGEGYYNGLTDGDTPTPAPNQFDSCQWDNNVNARTGNEMYQIGQLGSDNWIDHNVGAMSATRWRSPFEESQYFGEQLGIRNGTNYTDSCIFLGSGEQTLNAIAYNKVGLTYDGGTLTFRADTYQYSKGFIANYLESLDGATLIGMKILFDSCVFGNSYFYEDSVFNMFYPGTSTPIPNYTNTPQILRAQVDSNLVEMFQSYTDTTKSQLIANAAMVDSVGRTIVDTLPGFDWNSGFNTNDFKTYSMWGNWILASLGDEFTNQIVFRQGKPIIFNLNDMVMWLGKYYRSKINGNWNHMPNGTDAYWQQITWMNGSNVVTYPPDNYLLSPTNFYYLRGMGLQAHQ